MARLIKNTQQTTLGFRLTTVMEDSANVRDFKIGDIIEGLRYADNGDVKTVSGRLADIKYTMASRLTWNKRLPKNTLAADMTVTALIIDASQNYESKLVEVPAREIVEFADETRVKRMMYEPFLVFDMEMKYSDLSIKLASIQVDDVFDSVRIMDLAHIGEDITGKFKVLAFAYAVSAGKLNVTGIAFENVETGEKVVADLNHILALNEVFTYELAEGSITDTIAALAAGDTVVVNNQIDTTGSAIVIRQQNIAMDLEANVVADGSSTSGIVVSGGSATLSGDGLIVTETPYDRNHANGVISVRDGGELTFEGSGISAVIEDDPVNKGQFGVVVTGNGKVTVNDGNFTAGWYCLSGNGSTTTADSAVVINDGEFTSVADYAIYHPDPGRLVINGGVIKGAAGALAANNGIIEINGGEFSVLGGGDTGSWGDGTSGLTDVAINLNAKYGDIVCRITGGTFIATAAGTIMIKTGSAHTVDLKISGGRFTAKPNAEWIAEGFVCTEEPVDGFYEVVAA